jgi:hypothetical protein
MKNFERFMALPLGNIVRVSDSFTVIPGCAHCARTRNPEVKRSEFCYFEIPGSRYARPGMTEN